MLGLRSNLTFCGYFSSHCSFPDLKKNTYSIISAFQILSWYILVRVNKMQFFNNKKASRH